MKRFLGFSTAVIIGTVLGGCSSKVMVPPRIDLKNHEVIGVIGFTSSAEGKLGELATRRFVEAARRDQGMVRIVNLGSEQQVLNELGRDRLDRETYQILGKGQELNTIVTGRLTVSDIRPSIRIGVDLMSAGVSADVDAELDVEMIEASTGASLWSASGSDTRTIGQISVLGGKHFAFNADDPEKAYGELIGSLVAQVSRDFQVRWVRR
jgi:hypothetical protein